MEVWFTENQAPGLRISCRVNSILYSKRSQYQEIAILETTQFGRMLTLDDVIQTTEKDEFFYHEMIAHVPLFTHPCPQTVLIIGGGDGGALREVLKHPEVKRVDLVEIDREVVEAARAYLPTISCGYDDPRANLIIDDGARFVKDHVGDYDVILTDSTDPVGAATVLFGEEFYRAVFAALKEDGIFVAQTESPLFNGDLIRRVHTCLRGIFPIVRLYTSPVPTYPGGLWSFTLASKRHEPSGLSQKDMAGIQTRYYTPEVGEKAFVLPRFVREVLES